MYQKVLNFIKYNNAFTIIFVICFLSFGIGFAASPEMHDSVYSSEETVVSIDNNLIVSADLDNFNFDLRINSVTEDEKNYYAVYSYQTLAIEDGFWQNKEIEKTLTVSKEALGGKDLGLYVAEELGENIKYELSYLKRVQKLEKEKGESQKVVTVEYSGLIGKLLNPKEKVIEGYSPVILEVVPEVAATVESNPEEVVVSTPYYEPPENPTTEPTPPPAESAQEPISTSTPPQTEPTTEPTPPPAESAQEPISTSTPPQTEPTPEPTPPPAESAQEPISTSTPPQTEPTPEATSTPPQAEPVPEPTPQPSLEATAGEALPAPEEMIDEELVQEVVEKLLQNQATSTPTQ